MVRFYFYFLFFREAICDRVRIFRKIFSFNYPTSPRTIVIFFPIPVIRALGCHRIHAFKNIYKGVLYRLHNDVKCTVNADVGDKVIKNNNKYSYTLSWTGIPQINHNDKWLIVR
jgi:hypothetical protein